jgi:methylmalonyl-CoA/ethylmalonyl-CoA epimerase
MLSVALQNFFGEEAVFEHVGVAVSSIRVAGQDRLETVADETQQVSVAFINLHGIQLELIEPLTMTSPISQNLRQGQKVVHLCFRVPALEHAIIRARQHGFHCIAQPVPAAAFDQRKIAWLFSQTYGLIELLEADKEMREINANSST